MIKSIKASTMSSLAALVQALPAELYNKIYEFTFTFNDTYSIDHKYKPPSCLQVNRATRNAHTKTYYSSVFHVESRQYLVMWLASLNADQADALKDVLMVKVTILVSPHPSEDEIAQRIRQYKTAVACEYLNRLEDFGGPGYLGKSLSSALKFKVRCTSDDRRSGWWSYNDAAN